MATETLPGLLRCPSYVEAGWQMLRDSGRYTRAEIARFKAIGDARREVARTRLEAGEVRILSLVGLTALEACRDYAEEQACYLKEAADLGWEIGFVDNLPPGAFGQGAHSSLVVTSRAGGGLYTQFPALPDGKHEAWLPNDPPTISNHLSTHSELWSRSIPLHEAVK